MRTAIGHGTSCEMNNPTGPAVTASGTKPCVEIREMLVNEDYSGDIRPSTEEGEPSRIMLTKDSTFLGLSHKRSAPTSTAGYRRDFPLRFMEVEFENNQGIITPRLI